MSECIPFDIQVEILRRIPDVKSLIRFKSVSKTWKSLIDSSQFIRDHTHRKHHHHRIFLCCTTGDEALETQHVSILDDDSFPQHKVPLTIPPSYYAGPSLVGTSHGLLCFRNYYDEKTVAVVWNPSIRKSITIDLPSDMLGWPLYGTVFGFGVCPRTLHFKLIKISYIRDSHALENIICIPCQVEVFTGGVWRSPLCIKNLPRRTIAFWYESADHVVVIDGFIYWHAYDRIPGNGIVPSYPLIISFDMTSEEFSEIYLPDGLTHSDWLYISKLKESLVILQQKGVWNRVFEVWKMEHGVSKTFSKLYTIVSGDRVHGFRKSGEPIIRSSVRIPRYAADDCGDWDCQGCGDWDCQGCGGLASTLYVYEPDSRKIKDVGISALRGVICWSSYVETLLSLD